MNIVQRFDTGGRLGRAKPTSIGGAYIPARVSRTGVLRYVLPNGQVRRELRHPDEIFRADSLASLADIPVIDLKHHTALLTPEDYQRVAVGHVKSYSHDDRFIESELVVQDRTTLDAIDEGERTEISCGYVCKLDMTPGTWNGEPYDCVQRNIRYNHVALCPPNRGRAGPEVALRLDSNGNQLADDETRLDARERRLRIADAVRDRLGRADTTRKHTTRDRAVREHIAATIGDIYEAERSVSIIASTPRPVDGAVLQNWDLDRFKRNPVVLWAHDALALPIGRASDVEMTDEGLRMVVHFASAHANPLADQILQAVREGVVRAVSVGYEPGNTVGRDRGVVTRARNTLLEVSFVNIPADDNAGTSALNPAAGETDERFFSDRPDDEEEENVHTDALERARRAHEKRAANAWRNHG